MDVHHVVVSILLVVRRCLAALGIDGRLLRARVM